MTIAHPPECFKPRDPAIASFSRLKHMLRSPAHYLAYCTTPPSPPTAAMELGTAVHHAILEPEKFAERYVVTPDFGPMQSSTNRAKRDAWKAAQPERTVFLGADDYQTILNMRNAVRQHPLARDLLLAGKAEGEIEWVDHDTGLTCRGRPDYVVPELGMSLELKTAQDASPSGFGRAVANMLYDLQGVMYLDGLRTIHPSVREHVWLVVESEAPHVVAVYRMDDPIMERGALLMTKLLAQLRKCVDSGNWHGYSEQPTIQNLTMPGWAFSI